MAIRLRPQCIVLPHRSVEKYFVGGMPSLMEALGSNSHIYSPVFGWDFDENLIVLNSPRTQEPLWEILDQCIEAGLTLVDEQGSWCEGYISFKSKLTPEYAFVEGSSAYPGQDCNWLTIEKSFASYKNTSFVDKEPLLSTSACRYIFGDGFVCVNNPYQMDLPDTKQNFELFQRYIKVLRDENTKFKP